MTTSRSEDILVGLIALGLRKLRDKQLENPWKKHDNIPL